MLTLPEELLLLGLHDKKGTVVSSASMALPYGLAGAVLLEGPAQRIRESHGSGAFSFTGRGGGDRRDQHDLAAACPHLLHVRNGLLEQLIARRYHDHRHL